jgi:hypothetical protein
MTRAGAGAPADAVLPPPAPSPEAGTAARSLLLEVAAGALGTALLLWLLRRVLFPPVLHTFGHDFVFWYPVWQFYAEGLALGELRLWNPLSYGGVSLYPALLQLRVFDPISFVVIAVGHRVTTDLLALYNWDVLLRAWIPAVATHVFLRRFAEHAVTRLALIMVALCSSFLLVMLRAPGASQGFLWAPFIAILLYRIVWLGADRWRDWLALAVFLGLNWQSYFAAPHLTFVALFLLGIALFQPGRLRRFLGTPRLALKAGVAALIAGVMLVPLLTVLGEGAEVLYLPRVLDSSRDRGDVGPIQYEPIPSAAVREVGVFMPVEFFASNGTPSNVWNFLQLVTPTGNWHREGGRGWGNPEEAFMYLGLPVYAIALWGLIAGRHPLRRAWLMIFAVFGLLLLGPLGGAQSFLAWVFPLVRLTRHTHTYTPYFQMAVLFFFVLGGNRLLPALSPAASRDAAGAEPAVSARLRRWGAIVGTVFVAYLVLVETPRAFRFFSPGKAVTPVFLALGLVALWYLARTLSPGRLFRVILLGHLAGVPLLMAASVIVGLHTPPVGGLAATLGSIAGYWALFLGLPLVIWWAATRGRAHPRLTPRTALVLLGALLAGDQLYYASYTDYLWRWPRPDRMLGVSAHATPLRFSESRGLYPAQVERTLPLGQAIRYPELLLRQPYLLTAPRGVPDPDVRELSREPAWAGLDRLRRMQRWNSFYVPRRYRSLLHSETPAPVLARIWALGEPLVRFVPDSVVVADADFAHLFRDLGPSRGRLLLARAVTLAEEPPKGTARPLSVPAALAITEDLPAAGGAALNVTDYRADRITLDVTAPRPGFVVLSDGFHPRWTARVDGRPAPVLRADHLLKAVPLPPGRHTLDLRFDPGLLVPALALFTALGVAGLVGAAVAGLTGLLEPLISRG